MGIKSQRDSLSTVHKFKLFFRGFIWPPVRSYLCFFILLLCLLPMVDSQVSHPFELRLYACPHLPRLYCILIHIFRGRAMCVFCNSISATLLCICSSFVAVAGSVSVSVNAVTVAEVVPTVVSVSSAVTVSVIAHLLAVSLSQLCDRNDKHTYRHNRTHTHTNRERYCGSSSASA